MPIDWSDTGRRLAGFGAGLQGRGAEWQYYQDRIRIEDEELAQAHDQQLKMAVFEGLSKYKSLMGAGQPSLARNVLVSGVKSGVAAQRWKGLLDNHDAGKFDINLADVDATLNAATMTGLLKNVGGGQVAALQELAHVEDVLTNPDKYHPDYVSAIRIGQGIDPRAGISAAERMAGDPELTTAVASSQAEIAAAKSSASETAKLGAQKDLQPSLREAVMMAESRAKAAAEQAQLDESNASAFAVYEAGMSGLIEALGETMTGPFVGMLPALTANQQFAVGARAALAPVMKQMFRASGEGIFTDKDQELLLAMIPDRTDRPAARLAKLQNIDAIVRAKLGMPLSGGAGDDSGGQRSRENVLNQYGVGVN